MIRRPAPALGGILALSLAAWPMAQARAVECYRAGTEAMDAGRFADAARAFEVAAGLPGCADRRAGLLHGQAVALERLLDAGGAPTLACRAADVYRQVVGLEPTSRVAGAARTSLPALEARCRALAPPPPPTSPPPPSPAEPAPVDHTLEWGLTLGAIGALAAGGALLVFAADAQSDREAARDRILASDPGSAEEAAALTDFGEHDDRTYALGVTGYAVGAAGLALAAAAAVVWAVQGEPTPLAIGVGPGGLSLQGRF